MSATSDNSQADPSTSASVEEIQDADQPSGPSITANTKPPEKTISCVSCRKRKLKCDRVKPKCGTCTRLRHECEFPERRRNQGSKRRNIKELEARLAQVETQLISESKQTATTQTTLIPGAKMDWNSIGMSMNLDPELDDDGLLDPSFDISQPGLGFSAPAPTMPTDYFGSYELIGLGLQEPLPPQDMMDELHTIYFEKYHRTMPMMHKLRYYASLDRAPHMRPPICLRYAMWTVAASLSDKYSSFEAIFYERARRYLQDAEMKVRPLGNLLLLPLKRYRGTEKRLLLCTTHRLGVSWQLTRLRKLSSHEHG
jgi:Fungal Zn(2)-Cys(6) binuclear cluster domain